ncbi:MAG TPA: penicillin-binding protein, partial [Stellaceae bacterium]
SVAAPVFRDFMYVALKDKPAIPFRIPPGIRLVRVDAGTGLLARPGDKNVIYEAFKPGTEPSGDAPVPTVVHGPISDDEDAASLGGPTDEPAAESMTTAGGAPATGPAPVISATPAPSGPPRTVPSSGTGGLY